MRTKKNYKVILTMIGLLVILGLMGCANEKSGTTDKVNGETDAGEPVNGGTLNVAFAADPDTIDWMYTAATATRDVGWHIFETLFALDKDYATKPMLAEDYEISEDKKVYTIKVREGVNFHDGTILTAEDVVASIERWRKVSPVGVIANEYIDKVVVSSEFELEVHLTEPYIPLLADFAAPKAALIILPAEIAEEAGEQPLSPEQLIGTGPYQFEKWDRGAEILLSKFSDYTARDETDWGGLTGKKTAYFDEVKFLIVKDAQVMINGLKTGIYDYAQTIPTDLYEVIEATPNIDPVTYLNGYSTITPDKSEAPFDDLKVRQALNFALDKEAIAKATYGTEQFYSMDGALFDPEQVDIYSDKGSDQYLIHDKDQAKKLLEESSYNGEELTIMYSNNSEDYKKISQIAKQQLEEVGFKIELVSYEWATYLEKWTDPDNWDLVVVGWSTRFSPNELGMLAIDSQSSGWYNSERWTDQLSKWGHAETPEVKKEILTEMNQTVSDELPFIKIANTISLDIKSEELKEYDNWLGQRFWNTWKAE